MLKLRRVLGRARRPWTFPKNSRVNPASRPLHFLHIDKNAGNSLARLDAELFRFGGQLFEQHFGGNRAK